MIEYIMYYDESGENRPRIEKKFTASSGETFSMSFGYETQGERENLSSEEIYVYLENLLSYIKLKSVNLTLIHLDEETDGDGWHLNGGWSEMMWANEEILRWWEYVYYREEDDDEEVVEDV